MTVRTAWLGLVVIVLSFGARADDWGKQFNVSGHPELQVTANDASVRVSAWDKDQVDVRVHTAGVSIPGDLDVTGTQTGNTVRVELHSHRTFCVGICIKTIQVTIQLPRNSTVDVRTSDGAIEADELSGDVRLQSGDGRIVAHDASGSLRAETSDGRIDVDGRFEKLRVATADGHVSVKVSSGSKMDSDWSISTKDGNVEVELPADLAADLEAHTSDGHIDVNLPLQMQGSSSRDSVRGKLNNGGRRLEVRTGDGAIRLRSAHATL